MGLTCKRCGWERREHSYNGACYGLCGEFKADGLDWQTWKGGTCPTRPDAQVEIIVRAESVLPSAIQRVLANEAWKTSRADNLRWEHLGTGGDIIAYKIAG